MTATKSYEDEQQKQGQVWGGGRENVCCQNSTTNHLKHRIKRS